MLRAGIVGLPNVGKSTLFNALTQSVNAQSANYPFCTIEPNVGVVTIPDERLYILQDLVKTQTVIPTAIEFVDIAGLVKGASKGEGLGNQFLANIREVDAIIEVVRCFDDPDTIHVNGKIDPISDIETINLDPNYKAVAIGENSSKTSVVVKGTQNVVNSIDASMITAQVDLSGYSEGDYEVTVKAEGDDNKATYAAKTTKIKVRITKK